MADNDSQTAAAAAADYLEFYSTAQFVTGLLVYPVVCLFGLVGNTLILCVLTRKSFSSSTDVFLAALAISDTAKLASDLLYFVTCLLMETNPGAGNKAYAWLYPYAHFVFNASVCVSSWLTVSVSVERYILVCHPTRSKTMTSVTRSKVVSAGVFVVMTLVAVPSALRYRTVEVRRPAVPAPAAADGTSSWTNETTLNVELTALWRNATFAGAYNWLQSLLRSIVPLCVLVVTSCFITRALWKTRANKKMASRNRITTMLTIVVVFFIVCILPDAVMSSLYLGYTESDSYLVRGVREVTDALLAVNAAVNFALYVVFNRRFKASFERQFCAVCVRGTSVDPTATNLEAPSAAAATAAAVIKTDGGLYQRLLDVRRDAAAALREKKQQAKYPALVETVV